MIFYSFSEAHIGFLFWLDCNLFEGSSNALLINFPLSFEPVPGFMGGKYKIWSDVFEKS